MNMYYKFWAYESISYWKENLFPTIVAYLYNLSGLCISLGPVILNCIAQNSKIYMSIKVKGILKKTHWQVLWQLELSKNIICIQCSVLPPVHQHGNHLDTDFQDRDQAADGSQRKPPHLRRPGRVLQQCCQQDAQQLMCNRENEINQTKRCKCHLHT